MLFKITYIFAKVFSASVQENVAIFKGKDYRDSLRSCIGIMLLNSIFEFGTPYQAECGVSKVVYLPCGRHGLLADERNEASHFCYVDLLAGAPQGRIWKHENP